VPGITSGRGVEAAAFSVGFAAGFFPASFDFRPSAAAAVSGFRTAICVSWTDIIGVRAGLLASIAASASKAMLCCCALAWPASDINTIAARMVGSLN
jgi:hypothetical protein